MYYTLDEFKKSKLWNKFITSDSMDTKILELISAIKKQDLQKYPDPVRGFLEYDVDGPWSERFNLIRDKFKRNGFSLDACKVRYGDVVGEKLWTARRAKVGKTAKDYPPDVWEELRKKKISTTIEAFTSRYGEEEGKRRRQQYLNKRKETYKRNGKYPPTTNLKKFIERYGEDDGKKRYREWIDKRKRTLSLQGFIERFGVEGPEKYKEFCKGMDTRSKESFIKRYGTEEGTMRYEKSIERARYTQSEEYYLEKYGLEEGSVRWTERVTRRTKAISSSSQSASRMSQILFWKVFSKLNNDLQSKCYFKELNEEFIFFTPDNNTFKSIIVDFKLGNKIVEFDGTYWHKNRITLDVERDNYLRTRGYDIMRVSESDYKTNGVSCIDSIVNFLTDR